MIPLSLAVYPGEASSTNQRVAIIVSVGLVSVAVAAGLIATFSGIRWIYARRRRPLVWIAIRVLTTASGETTLSIPARGISDRGGSLSVSLPREQNDFLWEGDSFLAINVHTKEQLGLIEVILVEQDSCLCMVSDRMQFQDFWAGLENRMAHDFSPPIGVEFSRCINQDSIDFAKRLIRSWGR
jgi:hypothetical protein